MIATKTYPGGVVFASVLGGSSIEAIVDNDTPAADLDALAEDAKTLMIKLRVLASEHRQSEQGKKEGT